MTCKVIDPGRFDFKIVIEDRTSSIDGAGAPTETWATHASAWAIFEELSGLEALRAKKVHAETEVLFTMQSNSDLLSVNPLGYRINVSGTYYNILKVLRIPASRPAYIEIYAKKIEA